MHDIEKEGGGGSGIDPLMWLTKSKNRWWQLAHAQQQVQSDCHGFLHEIIWNGCVVAQNIFPCLEYGNVRHASWLLDWFTFMNKQVHICKFFAKRA